MGGLNCQKLERERRRQSQSTRTVSSARCSSGGILSSLCSRTPLLLQELPSQSTALFRAFDQCCPVFVPECNAFEIGQISHQRSFWPSSIFVVLKKKKKKKKKKKS